MRHLYPRIFSPIKLGPVEIPNRFYFAPHGVSLSVGTKPSNDFVAYSVAHVRDGGCGLVVHSLTVHPRATVNRSTPFPSENVPAFRAMADSIHSAGGRVFAEIWYQWIGSGFWQTLSPPAPPLGASAIPYEFEGISRSTHQMGKDEILAMRGAFRQSTRHLREAGYDGVMLHAAHGALLEQFVSPYFNRRTDEYGGSAVKRRRFLVECLEAAQEGGNGQMAVGIRFNCDELLPGGYDTYGAREVLESICGDGLVDFVDLDVAVEPQQLYLGMPPVFVERQVYAPYVRAVRTAAGEVPVLSVLGRLTSNSRGRGRPRRRHMRHGGIGSGPHCRTGACPERQARKREAQPDLYRLQLVHGFADPWRGGVCHQPCQLSGASVGQRNAQPGASPVTRCCHRWRAWGIGGRSGGRPTRTRREAARSAFPSWRRVGTVG